MYPDYKPKVKLNSTISHPINTESVIGFAGRNTKLGRESIIMKQDAISDDKVLVPTEAVDQILDRGAELLVLNGDDVKAMTPEDFDLQNRFHTIEGRGQTATMNFVSLNSDSFRTWERENIVVGE